MSQLFIDLYFDEDVNVLVADLIRARGFKAITAREVNNLQESDEQQLNYAVSQQQVLVTHNRVDFEQLAKTYFHLGKTHYGIILSVRRSPQEIAKRLLVILNHVTADEMIDQVRYI